MDLSSKRTQYLEAAYDQIKADLLPQAPGRERVALSWSFPCRNARGGGRSVRLGEHHFAPVQGSETGEQHVILVSPRVWTCETDVLGVLAHEMVHACLPPNTKHKKAFKDLAGVIGLEPTKQADPAEGFLRWISNTKESNNLPPFPAGAIAPNVSSTQSTRLRLWECDCPVKVRVASNDFRAVCSRCDQEFKRQEGNGA